MPDSIYARALSLGFGLLATGSITACSSGDSPVPGIERADGAVQISDGEGHESLQNPCFSPDGSELAFTVFTQGYNEGPAGVYRARFGDGTEPLSGRETILFDDDQDAVNLPGSCWTEEQLVLSSDREGRTAVLVLDPDEPATAKAANGSDAPATSWEPSLSPDGERVVFEGHDEEDGSDPGDLFVADVEQGTITELLVDDAFDDRQPNWSPTGDVIVFQRRKVDHDDWDLWIIDPNSGPDGSPAGAQRRTDLGDATDASWSPDGRAVVFSAPGEDEVAHLWVLDVRSGSVQQVTSVDDRADGAASWSPDGRWIVFESYPIERGSDGEPTEPASLWAITAPG